MTNELAMTDGRILRQNRALANRHVSEWYEKKCAVSINHRHGLRLRASGMPAPSVGRRRDRISVWAEIKTSVYVERTSGAIAAKSLQPRETW